MKIFILDTVKPQLQGAGAVHRWELVRNLSKLGCDIYATAYKNIELNGLHTNLLQTKKGVFGKLFSQFRYVRLLFNLSMKYRFDILYTRNGLTGTIGHVIKMLTGSKLVYELDGIPSDEWKLVKKEKNRSNMFEKIMIVFSIHTGMFALKKADAIIAVTHGIKNYLLERGVTENKVWVVENGANTELFKPIKNSNVVGELKNRLHINNDERIVLFVGNLAPWQGVEYLIHATPLIIKEIPKTKILIVGDGIMKEKLESLVKELNIGRNIIFTGTVPYENVPEYINVSDICVAPFIRERNEKIGLSPLKIYEYLACEKPVVASNIRGVGNLLESSNSGISVIPDNPNELAKAIIKLLNDKQLREQMGKNGREMVVNNYSWENTAKKTIEVFENILDKYG